MRDFKKLGMACLVIWFGILASAKGWAQPIDLHWSDDGLRCWYRVPDVSGPSQYRVVDIAKQTVEPAFDHARVQKSIAQEMGRTDERSVAISQLGFHPSATRFYLECEGRIFLWDESRQSLQEVKEYPPEMKPRSRLFLPPRASGASDSSTTITVKNEWDQPVQLFWIDREGRERKYQDLKPGEQVQQHTYVGHVWLLKTSQGNRLGCFQAKAAEVFIVNQALLGEVVRSPRSRRRRSSGLGRNWGSRRADSPNDQWRAMVRDHNFWLMPTADDSTNEAIALSHDANMGDSFQRLGNGQRWLNLDDESANQGDFRWAPNSQYVVGMQTKRLPEPRVSYIESSPRDQLQPKLRSYQYPKPGAALLKATPRLFSVPDGKEVPLAKDLFANPFELRFAGWSDDGERFWLYYNQRGHQVLRLLEVTAATGQVRTLIEETSDTFIQYSDPGKSVFLDLPNEQILWASERTGWNHLYRIDGRTGDVLNAVTAGEWNVKSLHKVDRDQGVIWFYAVGQRKEQDPYHEHFCRVNLDGSDFRILTEGDGTHRMKFVENEKYFVDTWSRVDQANVVELRSSDTGVLIGVLHEQDTQKRFGSRRLTERFIAKGRDGTTDIWGIIHWPKDFDPSKKYPVVENIYAGPHSHHVPKSFRGRYGSQHAIADAGMIVVQIDGMGTAWRSKAFHDVCYKNLRDAGFPDRIAWIKAAAKKYPQMDLQRVGIYGGSAGGQNAMAALLWHHDFYKVAVADCGCHDNRMDKIWWNEQWMGWPIDASYSENSNMENAHLLKGDLMLLVGELDRNVDPASTIQVVRQLIKHGKDFEFVLVAGAGHGAAETAWGSKKRLNFLKRSLQVQAPEGDGQ